MRVSNISLKNNIIHNLQKNNIDLQRTEKQIGSGQRIFKVSDDPANAIAGIFGKVRVNQIDQYISNSENANDQIEVTYSKLSTFTSILHRLKELTIQGANSTFSRNDRINIATEVEELLQEVVSLANSSFDDNYLFSGDKGKVQPFTASTSFDNELGKSVISAVDYNGDQFNQKTLVEKNESVEYSLSGNDVFWAEDHMIISLRDARNYVNNQEQSIKIDNYQVDFAIGDNLDVIIEKINQNVPSVKASKKVLPTGETTFSLISRYPHQLALEDIDGGNLLRDLGILKEGLTGNAPFNNIHANTLEQKGSIFDVLIRLRNDLINDDVIELSGKALSGLELGLENVLKYQSKISSVSQRLNSVVRDLSLEKVNVIERISRKEDVDVAEASINFNELNYLHRLSLQTASKYIRPSLLDFL